MGMAGSAAEALLLVAIVDGDLVRVVELPDGALVEAESGEVLDPAAVVLLGLDVVPSAA